MSPTHPALEVRSGAVTVRYDRHGTGSPTLLLIHGGRAHGGWWDGVVPSLRKRFSLLVPDLTGHGDSDHRTVYEPTAWVQDMVAVIEAAGTGPVQAVGHSMGGKVAIWLAAQRPDLVSGVVLVDCPVFEPGVRDVPQPPIWTKRVYPTLEQAVQRFQLQPSGAVTVEAELLCGVAYRSVREVPGGWSWKTDSTVRGRFDDEGVAERLGELRSPVGAIYALQSQMVSPANLDAVARRTGPLPVVAVNGSPRAAGGTAGLRRCDRLAGADES